MVRASSVAVAFGLALACLGAGPVRAADPPDTALAAIQRAIAAEEARAGAASADLLPLLERLAGLRFEQGNLGAATAAERRGLTIALSAFGPGSPRTAAAMIDLARAELDQLRYLDAEPLLIAAEAIITGNSGPRSAALIPVLTGLARVALARGNLVIAHRQVEGAIALLADDPRHDRAEPLRVLGDIFAAERRFDDGEQALKNALAVNRASDGVQGESLETARSLSALGNLYLRADRFADALAPLEQAASIDQARLAPNHPRIADDLSDVGIADEGLKRTAAARRMLAAAIGLLHQGHAGNSLRLAFAELELARIDRAAGRDAGADSLFRDAQRILNAAEDAERNRERRV